MNLPIPYSSPPSMPLHLLNNTKATAKRKFHVEFSSQSMGCLFSMCKSNPSRITLSDYVGGDLKTPSMSDHGDSKKYHELNSSIDKEV